MNELVLVGAGIASAVNLGLGFFIGRKMRLDTPPGATDRVEELSGHPSDRVEQHIHRLDLTGGNLSTASNTRPQLQDDILKAIVELRDASQQLQIDLRQTQQELHSFKTRRRRLRNRAHAKANATILSSAETHSKSPAQSESVQESNFRILDSTHAALQRPSARRPFPTLQLVAPYHSGEVPAPSDFKSVQCWDIGSDGFSFLASEPPPFLALILALGDAAERTYLAARVTEIAPFHERELEEFQIQCQFTDRLQSQLFKT